MIERGLRLPKAEETKRLASALGVQADDLAKAQSEFVRNATPGEGYTTVRSEGTEISEREANPPADRVRVLDLFCGCGGFSHGFEQSGHFAVTAGIDLLPDRVETFRRNHRYAVSIKGDIRTFPPDELDRRALSPEVIVGGPPCQGFSSIRPFRTLTEGDKRNTLVEEFVLIIGELRPRWFVFENVVGLLTHRRGEAFSALLDGFREAGYSVDWRVINMALLGLPQARERLVIVGSRDGERFEWPSPTHLFQGRGMAGRDALRLHVDPLFSGMLPPAVTVAEAIDDLPEIPSGGSAAYYRSDRQPSPYAAMLRGDCEELTLHEATSHSERMLEIIRLAGTNRSALPEGMTSSGFSSCYSRLEADKPSTTLTVNFVHPASNRCIHPVQDRALTPREGARLQGFPDEFQFAGKRAQVVKQIGNAVPPILGRALADRLAEAMGRCRVPSSTRDSSPASSSRPEKAASNSTRVEAG